jgi:hypothetical protein
MNDADRIYDQEYSRGHGDGYAGNQPDAPGYETEPAAARAAYLEGYREGQAAYRRTLEPAPRDDRQPLPRTRRDPSTGKDGR